MKLRSELYLEMLRQRDEEAKVSIKEAVSRKSSATTRIDQRLAQRRREREAQAAAWVEQQVNAAPPEVREQLQQMERDIAELGPELRQRGPMTDLVARQTLTRRQFGVAVMLGLVTFPHLESQQLRRVARRDPLLALGDRALLLVGHWDRWLAKRGEKVEMCTFVHF
jgi:hypothetical protein